MKRANELGFGLVGALRRVPNLNSTVRVLWRTLVIRRFSTWYSSSMDAETKSVSENRNRGSVKCLAVQFAVNTRYDNFSVRQTCYLSHIVALLLPYSRRILVHRIEMKTKTRSCLQLELGTRKLKKVDNVTIKCPDVKPRYKYSDTIINPDVFCIMRHHCAIVCVIIYFLLKTRPLNFPHRRCVFTENNIFFVLYLK